MGIIAGAGRLQAFGLVVFSCCATGAISAIAVVNELLDSYLFWILSQLSHSSEHGETYSSLFISGKTLWFSWLLLGTFLWVFPTDCPAVDSRNSIIAASRTRRSRRMHHDYVFARWNGGVNSQLRRNVWCAFVVLLLETWRWFGLVKNFLVLLCLLVTHLLQALGKTAFYQDFGRTGFRSYFWYLRVWLFSSGRRRRVRLSAPLFGCVCAFIMVCRKTHYVDSLRLRFVESWPNPRSAGDSVLNRPLIFGSPPQALFSTTIGGCSAAGALNTLNTLRGGKVLDRYRAKQAEERPMVVRTSKWGQAGTSWDVAGYA